MDLLSIENLSKIFKNEDEKVDVFDKLFFNLPKGSFSTLIGPSGSGKSTILRIIAGLTDFDSGQINWANPKPKISFIFQTFGLFPFLTVFENIEFGLKMSKIKKSERGKKVKLLIDEIGLAGFADKHPKELSGGMRQRVGIARALAMDPDLLLLDEPFSSLDEFTAENLRKLLIQIWHSRKMTTLMVTHLISEAVELSDQIIILTPKSLEFQKIVENKLPRPRDPRSSSFFELADELKTHLI